MKVSSITRDQSDVPNYSDEHVAEETGSDGDESMWLSSGSSSSSPLLFSESRWSLLDSFPAFLLSLVNLENEDSKLIPDGEFDFDWFRSAFPSQSFRSGIDFEVESAGSVATEGVDRDEPLFWALKQKIRWKSAENWDWFSISSQRMESKSSAMPLNSTGFGFHGRKITLNQAPKRRLVFNSRSAASKMMDLKDRRDTEATAPRIDTVPSRFKRGTRNCAGKCWDQKLLAMEVDRAFVEKDVAANEEVPIEMLLGLREFDGREGLGSELDDVVSCVDEV